MKIQWLGHSSFRILGSKTIVTDPYGEIGLRFPDVRADIVTVSHGHHDHNAVEAVKGEPAIPGNKGNCSNCRYPGCKYNNKPLPDWMKRRGMWGRRRK